ncbi:MAG: MucB/RseB C-terminal domain-containing protein [Burkholderiales bacterium]
MSRALGALVLCAATGWAHAQTSPEAVGWLRRIYQATEHLSYSGTFVYLQGNRTETSRIAHLAGASGGTEKLEVLEGAPREILRTRHEIRCYLPERQLVKVERRGDPRAFPAVLPEQVAALSAHYAITMGETGRIAGYDCQAVVLTPLDDLRYGYRLWADTHSGMLLKAQTLRRNGTVVEQFTFAQLDIGSVPRDRLRPPRAARHWRVEMAGAAPADVARLGWRLEPALPGFRKVVEIRRMLHDSQPVDQVVFSDGLAAVSVFIEPMNKSTESQRVGLAGMGAVNVVTRRVADHLVTVVGETPVVSVQRVAETVEYHKPQ